MTATYPVPAFWPLIDALTDCLCRQLAQTVGGPVARCCPMPGNALMIDDCCEGGGTAWTRLVRIDPIVAGATAGVAGVPAVPRDWAGSECGPALAQVVIGLGVMRCSYPMDEDATPPGCDVLTAETMTMMADIDALYTAGLCCDAEVEVLDAQPLSVTPQGPQGGCVGAELQVAYTMDLCPCQERG